MDTLVFALAPRTDAATVYVAAAEAAVGVPKIVPFEELRAKPAGKAGETVKPESPCDVIGVTGVIGVPATNTNGEPG